MVLWAVALLEALLLGGHMWQVVCIMVFYVSCLYYGSHLVMVGWVASLVVIANSAASTELSSLFCKLCFICAFDMCFLCAVCVFFLCVHLPKDGQL